MQDVKNDSGVVRRAAPRSALLTRFAGRTAHDHSQSVSTSTA